MKYDPKIVKEILERVSAGESFTPLVMDLAKNQGYPSLTIIRDWLVENGDFKKGLELARLEQADVLFDEIIEIADNSRNDWMLKNDPGNPGWIENGENIQRSKMRIEARKYVAARLRPRLYGERGDYVSLNQPVPVVHMSLGEFEAIARRIVSEI
jgi:hypothetical protein